MLLKKYSRVEQKKKRLKNELQLKVAAKSCKKISNMFAPNESKPVKVKILMNDQSIVISYSKLKFSIPTANKIILLVCFRFLTFYIGYF